MSFGSEFHSFGAVQENALSPMVLRFIEVTLSRPGSQRAGRGVALQEVTDIVGSKVMPGLMCQQLDIKLDSLGNW